MEGTDLRSSSASLSPRLSAVGAAGVSDEFATSGKWNLECGKARAGLFRL